MVLPKADRLDLGLPHVQTLKATAARIDRIAADPAAIADPHRIRRELLAARISLNDAVAELETMAGRAPFDALANGLLILHRARDLLHGLSMVVVAEAASVRRGGRSAPQRRDAGVVLGDHVEALLMAARAMAAMLLLSTVWMATAWDMGFNAVSGGAIMLFFAVNQDNPQPVARSFMVWTLAGIVVAYAVMVLVLPQLEGFAALAMVLLPAGLMAGGLLASVDPNFEWIRLAQRIPVRIALGDMPAGFPLAAGMSATVAIRPSTSSR